MRATFTLFSVGNYVAKSSYYCELARRGLIAALLVVANACSDQTPVPADQSEHAPSSAAEVGQKQERAQQDTSSVNGEPLKVLVFGDSISAAYGIARDDGWVALLQERLVSRYRNSTVINASVSGETTQGGRARLQAALDRHSPDLVFLELGGNDALRGYPIARLRENLTVMVTQAQEQGAKVVLLGMQIPPNYGPKYTREFAQAFKTVAQENEAFLVPFFLDGVALVEGMIQSDGIHPTTEAQPLLLETGWQALVSLMGERFPALR